MTATTEATDQVTRAEEVADHIHRAAEDLVTAAEQIPDCNCAVFGAERMAAVVADLARAEMACGQVHIGLRTLERRHEGSALGLATLETQPLEGVASPPWQAKAAQALSSLSDEAASEFTGGQAW